MKEVRNWGMTRARRPGFTSHSCHVLSVTLSKTMLFVLGKWELQQLPML